MDELTFRELCLAQALGTLDEKGRHLLFSELENAGEERLVFFAEAVSAVRNSDREQPASNPSPEVKERILEMAATESQRADTGVSRGNTKVSHGNTGVSKPEPGLIAKLQKAWASLSLFPVSTPPDAPGRGFPLPRMAFAAVVFGAGFGVHVLLDHLPPSDNQRIEGRQASVQIGQGRIVALEDSLAKQKALLAVLASQHLRVAELKAQGQGRSGFGRVMWDPQQEQGILHVAGLPPAPAGQAYQLWILVDDKRDPCLNAGSFKIPRASLDGETFRFRSLEAMGKTKLLGFEITLELKAGHPHPAGPSLLRTETFM